MASIRNEIRELNRLIADEEREANSFGAICKDCGNGTLNNYINRQFEPNLSDEGEYGREVICCRCGSNHVEVV